MNFDGERKVETQAEADSQIGGTSSYTLFLSQANLEQLARWVVM